MAYGAGRSRLLAERGREQAAERAEYEKQLRRAENARRIQGERKAGWSMFGKAIGSLFGPVGIVAGEIAGKTIGDLGTVGGKQAERYGIDIDVGKFDVGKKHDYAAVQDMLNKADEGEFWQDVTDVGTTAMTAFTLGGGTLEDPGAFSPWTYGGKGAAAGEYGKGLFGKGTKGSLWEKWRRTGGFKV
tara:strand:- start:1096 stop:1656 length:561 start_codon:yes stop_codon:yes gene_type:complete